MELCLQAFRRSPHLRWPIFGQGTVEQPTIYGWCGWSPISSLFAHVSRYFDLRLLGYDLGALRPRSFKNSNQPSNPSIPVIAIPSRFDRSHLNTCSLLIPCFSSIKDNYMLSSLER